MHTQHAFDMTPFLFQATRKIKDTVRRDACIIRGKRLKCANELSKHTNPLIYYTPGRVSLLSGNGLLVNHSFYAEGH